MLGLPARLSTNLTELGITEPTPIQKKAIPLAMEGRDVLGLARTGTGKTAACALPMLIALMRMEGKPAPKSVRALVLAPTRELAKQIQEAIRDFANGTSVRTNLVIGGASLNAQANRLERGTDILIATPGRLIDLLERKAVRLDAAKFLVLDEADRERCVSREPGEAPMHIELRGEPPLALTAPPEATCDFFRRRTRELATLSEPSNDQTVLHAVPDVGVMRAPDGEVVLVRFALRPVATHEVLVDMDCDHMPRVEPDPLTLGGGQIPVVAAPERPRELTHEVDHELVQVECTRNTY